jgi:hypothetical protein
LIPRHLPNFHQENIYAIELAKFVLKIKALRDITQWTWQTMMEFQKLFSIESVSSVNGDSWMPVYETAFDFLYRSITPHISEEGKRAYVEGGLCEDITNSSLCPAFFRSQYLDVYRVLQRNALESTSKISVKIRCNCHPGNCENCVCVKANRICGLWCHSSGKFRREKVECQNCKIFHVIKQVKKFKDYQFSDL